MKTKLILNQNVESLGRVGAIVEVSSGYARNYLLPYGLAGLATPVNIELIERLKAEEIRREKEKEAQAKEMAESICSGSCTIEVEASADGKLFGSVTANDIQRALEEQKITVDKKDILLKAPLRKVGAYQVDIRCYANLRVTLKLWVVRAKSRGEG